MAEQVILRVDDRLGYAPDQIKDGVTLGGLLDAVERAVEEYGSEAMIVLSNGDRYGATYGRLSQWDDLFVPSMPRSRPICERRPVLGASRRNACASSS